MATSFSNGRAALVMAHPGHELRVYHWFSLARPLCFVLTDGSARSNKSRLNRTTKLLEQNGARSGCIYGRLTDQSIYSSIIKGEVDLFIDLAREVARELVRAEIEYVVGDAMEGYNPAHDVCRLIINAAVEVASREIDRDVLNFEVFLTGESDKPEKIEGDILIDLDENGFTKKLQAVRAYAEIAADVERILDQEGLHSIRTERLHSARQFSASDVPSEIPYYEIHGEKQVAAGHYEQVLRYREHVRPIAQALMGWVQRETNRGITNPGR